MKSLLKLVLCLSFLLRISNAYGQQYNVTSPNGNLQFSLDIGTTITYSVSFDGNPLITPSTIAITLTTGQVLGANEVVASTATRTVNGTINTPFGKNTSITEHFNELKVDFESAFSLIVRAYDEGVAYRFVTALGGDVIVESETATFNLSGTPAVLFPEADGAMQSWERSYFSYASINEITINRFAVTPTMFSYPGSIRVVIAESDLFDYPGMYVQRTATGMKGKWAHYPKTVSDPGDMYKYHRVLTRENYIAKTTGTREYPWRVVIVSSQDKDLLNNELIYKLARPSVVSNTAFIKPGKSAWEWWHDAILETQAIPSGLNNLNLTLYKYYVDFAAQYKLEYMTMDAGWSTSFAPELCQYAASKNVKIILWDFINLPVEDPNRLAQLKLIGAAGVKIDLIERDDQVAINWLQQIAQKCADLGLMVIFHGVSKPTGLQRTYPNIVNFEAVRGAECAKWDDTPNPDYHLQFPFVRMLAGPLDYTPGSMRNVHRAQFSPTPAGIPKSMGTRAHELAMYILFDQTLGYLCDSPTEYRKYSNVMSFMSRVPTTWDRTIPLAAEVGKYAVVAKQKGQEFYVAAMTNGEAREVEVDFSFLPDGEFFAEVLRDNTTTATDARQMTREVMSVNNQTKKTLSLVAGGGATIYVGDLVTSVGSDASSQFSVYQNVEGTQLTVQTDAPLRSIYIADVTGRLHYADDVTEHRSKHDIDVSSLEKGQVYIVYGTTMKRFYSARFVIR